MDANLINHEANLLRRDLVPPHGLTAVELNLSGHFHGDTVALPSSDGSLELWGIAQSTKVDVPYWNVKVDKQIISSHGDIWNPRAEALMAGLFRIATPCNRHKGEPRRHWKNQGISTDQDPITR